MKTKKHKLNYTESFDFLLYGLTSNENDYRLIWKMNNTLKFGFERVSNLIVKLSGSDLDFPQFEYDDPDTLLHYRLLSNKSEKGFLLEDFKNIDYLIIVQGDFDDAFASKLSSDLKKVDSIHGVFRLSPATLKNRERLLI